MVMRIIAIEGLDKSGKHSVTVGLADRLRADGYKVAVSEFHRYDTPTGALIRQWLYGQYKVNQHTIELIMAADKYAQKEYFENLEEEGYDFLILDRYIGSHIVYANANGMDGQWIDNLLAYLPDPYCEIFIDVSPETSMKRKGKHGDNDRYESDKQLLAKAREGFINLRQNQEGDNTLYATVSGEGTIEESIHDTYEAVSGYLFR